MGQLSRDEAETQMFHGVISKAFNETSALVVVGYDRRFLSEQFAQRAAEVMAGNGFRIALFQEAAPDAVDFLGGQRTRAPAVAS